MKTLTDKGREMARDYNPEQVGVWWTLFKEMDEERAGMLDALRIAQREMEAAAYNMTRNGYEESALPVQCLKHAASIAASARGES